jgi:hypothetical protein
MMALLGGGRRNDVNQITTDAMAIQNLYPDSSVLNSPDKAFSLHV